MASQPRADDDNPRNDRAPARRFPWSVLGVAALVVALLATVVIRGRADRRERPATAPAQGAAVGVYNPAHARLVGMAEGDRAAAATELLAGQGCDKVVRGAHQGTRREDGTAFWSFACGNGRSFMVSLKADAAGSRHIADCAVMKALGVPCFRE